MENSKRPSLFLTALGFACFAFLRTHMKLCFVLLVMWCVNVRAATLEVYATNIDSGGTDLRWKVYLPISGGPTYPAVILGHGGEFKQGDPGPSNVAQDLANNGFVTFAVEYRLAPPHIEMTNAGPPGDGQQDPPSDGRPPQQTDDMQRAIRAARSPASGSVAFGKVNGKVVVAAGSSGATLALWWAIAGSNNDDTPDAVVGCS